jgi:hypothetical protein
MAEGIDFTPYLSAPAVDVAGGVALGVALLVAVPKKPPAPVKRAAQAVRASTVALQAAWKLTEAAEPPDRRGADHRMDLAWNAFWCRLHGYAELPPETYPRAERAAALEATMFDDGLAFLKLPYAREWAESARRLRLLEDKKTASELREIVGEDFITEVQAAHAAYGVAIGITEAQTAPPDVAKVQQPLRDLQAAVRNYALQVLAVANDNPDFVSAARDALLPIDQVRATTSRPSSTSAADASAAAPAAGKTTPPTTALPAVTPDSPVPQVPEG